MKCHRCVFPLGLGVKKDGRGKKRRKVRGARDADDIAHGASRAMEGASQRTNLVVITPKPRVDLIRTSGLAVVVENQKKQLQRDKEESKSWSLEIWHPFFSPLVEVSDLGRWEKARLWLPAWSGMRKK